LTGTRASYNTMRVFITLALIFGAASAAKPATTVSAEEKVGDIIKGIVETAQKVKNLDATVEKKQESFEQSAKTQPLLLFKALPQRACPWSQYKEGKDWSFSSRKSDNKEECARSCIAAKGCTGFEVGPHTSQNYKSISYCALWFNKQCNNEKKMLQLNPRGYVATTFVMVKTVTVDVKTQEKTIFGTVDVEEKKTFQPDESKEHYNSVHKQEKSTAKKILKSKKQTPHHENELKKHDTQVTTTTHSESVARFEEFPQLACEFSQYKQGQDWDYSKIKDGETNTEACADACLNAGDCTGFEIGIDIKRGEYCAIWKSGACSTEKAMTSIPSDAQTVSTFVLASYHHQEGAAIDGFALVFLIACTCALLISLLLVGCICYRVLSRVCCRRTETSSNGSDSVVAGELVKATVVRGTPVGQRVDVVVVRGEAVDQQ